MGDKQLSKTQKPAGTAVSENPPALFQPLRIRGLDFQNRIWVSPMCQYSARDGVLSEFQFVHLAAMALRGPSLTFIEATAVQPQGRISPSDLGLWNDEQAESFRRLATFVHENGQKVGIQLAHAGRKASTMPPWTLRRGTQSRVAGVEQGGWPNDVLGPSDLSWGEGCAKPRAMTLQDIEQVVADFVSAAQRAVRVGIDVIEIHAAHGYLLSSFLSPVSNKRNDEYGGSFQNRARLPLRVVRAVRNAIPSDMPLTFRVSAKEWLDHTSKKSWTPDDTVELAVELAKAGADVLVVSSGGQSPEQKISRTNEYQTDIARYIRTHVKQRNVELLVGTVGRVTDPRRATRLLDAGHKQEAAGDIVLVGRQFLKEPSWVLRAAHELGVHVQWPLQYQLGRYGLESRL